MQKITAKTFAEMLNMSKPAFLAKVRRGEINPINKNDWQMDGEYLFTLDEVERVKETYKKPGLTIREAAERLDVSQTRVHQLIKREQDPLPAMKRFYNGKDRYFILEHELVAFMERNKFDAKKKKRMVSKKHGFFLFQLFKQDGTGQYARIMEINNEGEGIAVTESDRKLSLHQLKIEGFYSVYVLEKKRFITSKGYIKFIFPKPHLIKASAYCIIDELYKGAGVENMRIFVEDNQIEVEVKPIVLSQTNLNQEDIQLLKNCVVEGNVSTRTDGSIRLESDLEPISTFVPSAFKEKIRQRANELEMSIETFVFNVLKKEITDAYDKRQ